MNKSFLFRFFSALFAGASFGVGLRFSYELLVGSMVFWNWFDVAGLLGAGTVLAYVGLK